MSPRRNARRQPDWRETPLLPHEELDPPTDDVADVAARNGEEQALPGLIPAMMAPPPQLSQRSSRRAFRNR